MSGIFLPQGLRGDNQVTQVDVALQGPGASQADEGGRGDALGRLHYGDGAAGRPDAGGDDRDRNAMIRPGIGQEFPVAPLNFHPVERPGDPPGPVRVAAGEDVGGQVPGAAVQVIIAALAVLGEVNVGHRVAPFLLSGLGSWARRARLPRPSLRGWGRGFEGGGRGPRPLASSPKSFSLLHQPSLFSNCPLINLRIWEAWAAASGSWVTMMMVL